MQAKCSVKQWAYEICSQAVSIWKIDVVWDYHFQDSLNSATWNDWGTIVCTNIFRNGKIIVIQYFFIAVILRVNCFHFYQHSYSVEHLITNLIVATDNNMFLLTQKRQMSVCCYINLMFQKVLHKSSSKLLIVIFW